MKTVIRSIAVLIILSLIVISGYGANSKAAEDWPKKTIQIVVPYNAGGDTDFNARIYAKFLEKKLGKPVVVVNIAGAGGTLGSRKVFDAAPDGYTALFYHTSMIINQVMEMVDYGVNDFEIACIAAKNPGNIITVNKSAKWNNLKELVEDSKVNPGKVNFAADIGGTTFIMALMFQDAGAKVNIVDAGGAAARIAALKGGHIDIIPNPYGPTKPYLQSGDFKALGVTTEERNPKFPDIPTCKEQGHDVTLEIPYFFSFPKNTPKAIIEKFNEAVEEIATTEKEYAESVEKSYDQTPFFLNATDSKKYLLAQMEMIYRYKERLK